MVECTRTCLYVWVLHDVRSPRVACAHLGVQCLPCLPRPTLFRWVVRWCFQNVSIVALPRRHQVSCRVPISFLARKVQDQPEEHLPSSRLQTSDCKYHWFLRYQGIVAQNSLSESHSLRFMVLFCQDSSLLASRSSRNCSRTRCVHSLCCAGCRA